MKRSLHSLSHYKLLSGNMGELIPIGCKEVLPGDTWQHSTSLLLRVSPLLAPVMHPVHVRIHHWFVPYRLLWTNWETFITGGPDGEDASVYPTITMPNSGAGGVVAGSLADYLGVPLGNNADGSGYSVSALPFRAYAKIFNEWYRDEDLVTAINMSEAAGVDSTTNTTLQNVAWEKDYFTSARPWPQKGPDVTIPLGTTAPVVSDGTQPTLDIPSLAVNERGLVNVNNNNTLQVGGAAITGQGAFTFGDNTGLEVDLSDAAGVSIIEFREALAQMRYEEARARYGSRYTEYLRYLGVNSSDARLQRPEYLGGGKQTIQFSEVLQTGVTTDGDDTEGVGNLKGHGIAAMRSNRYRRFFEEHGIVLTLMSVKPKTVYMQGLERMWNRRTKEDFFQKEFAHVGQQEVLYKEVYAKHATPDATFGWQDRYDEYRRSESQVAGEFRTTLNFWHYAREFSSDPALNDTFVKSVPTTRVYASTATDQLWVMANHRIAARRIVPKTGSSFTF